MSRKTVIILLLAVVAACAGWGGYWAWNRWFSSRANPSLTEYPVRGIDISAHNGAIDFDALPRRHVQFAYIKATEGADFIDRRFDANVKGTNRLGVPAGAYHFFRFDSDGELQAWNFIHALKNRNLELPPAIDLEEWSNPDGFSTNNVILGLKRMLAVLAEEGITPIIYTNKDGYNRFVKGHLSQYPLWICSFTDPPVPSQETWHIWQFSHRGTLDGIEGYVDLNTISPELAATFPHASRP